MPSDLSPEPLPLDLFDLFDSCDADFCCGSGSFCCGGGDPDGGGGPGCCNPCC